MIKKAKILSILILVLGTSPIANAAISLVVGDGTTFTDPGDDFTITIDTTFWIGIHDSIGEMYKAEISTSYPPTGYPIEEADWTFNVAVYSPPAISTAPGWVFAYGRDSYFWGVDLSDRYPTEAPLPGVGCAVELLTLSEGSFYIYLIEYTPDPGFGPVLDSLLVNVVPEPTTILLLALGSLLLTRRRQ